MKSLYPTPTATPTPSLTPSTAAAAALPRPHKMQTFTRFRFFDCHKIFDRSPKKMEVEAELEPQKPCPAHTHTHTPMPNAQCHCLFINTNLCSVIKTQNFPGPVTRARAGAKTVEQSNESDGFIVLLLLCVGVGDLRPFRR